MDASSKLYRLAPTVHVSQRPVIPPVQTGHRPFNLDIARSIWASLFNLSQEPIADHA